MKKIGLDASTTTVGYAFVEDKTVITPPLSSYILGGVTREFIIDLAKNNHIPFHEKVITEDMLKNADEIWVTGSSKEILPITTLNDQPVGTGNVGTVWQRMFEYYEAHKGQR